MSASLPHPLKTHRGFSLVEVTLALGIVAFALIPLLALVPMGLTAAQSAIQQTAQTHIVQKIASDLSMLSFDDIDTYVVQPATFDADGRPTDVATDVIYRATMTRKDAVFPGSTALSDVEMQLQQVVVTIAHAHTSNSPTVRTTISLSNNGL